MAVELTLPKLHSEALPDTVMTGPHRMASCPACNVLRRVQHAADVHERDATQWSFAWACDLLHSFNTPRTTRAHVVFVDRVCARVDDAVKR